MSNNYMQKETVREAVRDAKEFIKAAEAYLRPEEVRPNGDNYWTPSDGHYSRKAEAGVCRAWSLILTRTLAKMRQGRR